MTREEYMQKGLLELREMARAKGIKSLTLFRKAELVEEILAQPETAAEALPQPEPAAAPKRRGRPPKPKGEEDAAKPEKKAIRAKTPVIPAASEAPAEAEAVAAAPQEPAAPAEASPPQEEKPAFVGRRRQGEAEGSPKEAISQLLSGGDCGEADGILEVLPDGYGFLRTENYMPGPRDVYVSIAQIRRFGLRTGDHIAGNTRPVKENERHLALLYIDKVNGTEPYKASARKSFEDMVPIYPEERITMEHKGASRDLSIRMIDLVAPIGKGQRGMIVSPPRAGKTIMLKKIANSITANYPDIHLIVLLIDERPEEVTDMQRSIRGEVIYSTFDEQPEHHTRVAEMVLERAQRLVESGEDVVILLDSITRLARAYNLTIQPTGRTLSGGLDPGALYKPKRFFGSARNMEGNGSLTVVATALVETGSRMDEIIFEEFKGTGNMELHLDRKMSEKRIFPAIDIYKSGTRREELLLSQKELECVWSMRKIMSGGSPQEVTEHLINMMMRTRDNDAFILSLQDYLRIWEKEGYSLRR